MNFQLLIVNSQFAQYSTLNVQCSTLNVQCSISNYQCSIFNYQLKIIGGNEIFKIFECGFDS